MKGPYLTCWIFNLSSFLAFLSWHHPLLLMLILPKPFLTPKINNVYISLFDRLIYIIICKHIYANTHIRLYVILTKYEIIFYSYSDNKKLIVIDLYNTFIFNSNYYISYIYIEFISNLYFFKTWGDNSWKP